MHQSVIIKIQTMYLTKMITTKVSELRKQWITNISASTREGLHRYLVRYKLLVIVISIFMHTNAVF